MKRWVSLLLLVVSLLLVSGCASNRVTVVDSRGRPIPTPHYSLFSGNMSVTFYYAKISQIKDVDGSLLLNYDFLHLNKNHWFTNDDDVILTIEITNPNRITYQVIEKIQYDLGRKESGRTVGISNQQYRQHSITLPTNDYSFITHYVEVQSDGYLLFKIGNFNYNLKEG